MIVGSRGLTLSFSRHDEDFFPAHPVQRSVVKISRQVILVSVHMLILVFQTYVKFDDNLLSSILLLLMKIVN